MEVLDGVAGERGRGPVRGLEAVGLHVAGPLCGGWDRRAARSLAAAADVAVAAAGGGRVLGVRAAPCSSPWGARRIAFEAAQRGTDRAPSRATVHRALERNGLVVPQVQRHKRKYKRWRRETPMALWHLDLVGGIYLVDGRECKMLSGIDDHSRFGVCVAVLAVPSGRAVAEDAASGPEQADLGPVWVLGALTACRPA